LKHSPAATISALNALAEIRSADVATFGELATAAKDPLVRNAALGALASSKAPDAGERLLKLWPALDPVQRRSALGRLTSTRPGAKAVVGAVRGGSVKKEELDGPAVEKLQTLLGDDAELKVLLGELASLFRPVLALDGKDEAWTEPGVTLDGPFTAECWVRLDPASAGRKAPTNDDGILGGPGQLDMNFFGGLFRVWVGGGVHDAIVSKKPITPQLWTHVAATRDAQGFFKLYQDGESVADQSKAAPQKFENVRIAWTQPKGGTSGAMDEFRIWNRTRTPDEIRRDFDRSFDPNQLPAGLVFHASGATGWGKLHAGAHVVRTSDFPPVMSPAEAAALDGKFAKYRALYEKAGDPTRGKTMVAVCQACHLFKGQGASIGPDLSGVGAMGEEGILRNIITPNAAMENGYRIFRVETKGGDMIDAFFVSEDNDAIVVRLPGVPDRRIPKKQIVKTQYLRRSLMPEGLLDGFSPEQVSDLFAFLRTMK
jgi:putative heme-binding domain-containing protein